MRRLWIALFALCVTAPPAAADDRPNILWITSEDNGPFLGCYGDPLAVTPNLDGLAARGTRYTNFFANAPVCAVARSTWFLGMPAVTTGTHHMRSKYRVPESCVPYAALIREAGYFVTNNSKTDYNTRTYGAAVWDQCGPRAHFKNRKPGQPFFAVFNTTRSHESSIFPGRNEKRKGAPKVPRVAAEDIVVPPYQVATDEVVMDHRRYYDSMTIMDEQVGQVLADLEASGEADNTIILYNSDHGGVTLRSKRYLYDSGTRVPLIVAFPEKYKDWAPGEPGSVSTRLTQFLDMPRTILALAGIDPPDRMTGRVFLGPDPEAEPETVLLFSNRFDESPDMTRGVTDGRWKYIRNYESDRTRFQMLTYPRTQLGQQSQLREYLAGRTNDLQSAFYQDQPFEELYDTEADPHEIKNLVGDPGSAAKLDELRADLDAHLVAVHDLGFLPETLMEEINLAGGETIHDWAQSPRNFPLDRVMEVAAIAGAGDPAGLDALRAAAADPNETVRFWGVLGLRVLGPDAADARDVLEARTEDEATSVRLAAWAALGKLGDVDRAIDALLEEARTAENEMHQAYALDGVKLLDAPEAYTRDEIAAIKTRGYGERISKLLQMGATMRRPGDSVAPPKWK
ncbi:MAG: sulfatase-like hydrolase/transferase [Planctomycetota bacterium]